MYGNNPLEKLPIPLGKLPKLYPMLFEQRANYALHFSLCLFSLQLSIFLEKPLQMIQKDHLNIVSCVVFQGSNGDKHTATIRNSAKLFYIVVVLFPITIM